MKLERKVKLTLTDEELNILDEAAYVLEDICRAYDDIECCDECPLRDMCDTSDSWDTYTPHNRLYELIHTLKNNKSI